MKINKLLLGSMIAAVCMTGYVYAQGDEAGDEAKSPCGQEKRCKLTDEQKAKLKECHEKYQQQTKDLRERQQSLRKEFKEVVNSDKFDAAKLDSIAAELKGVNTQLIDLRVTRIKAIKEVMPDFKLKDRRERKHKRGEGRGFGRGKAGDQTQEGSGEDE